MSKNVETFYVPVGRTLWDWFYDLEFIWMTITVKDCKRRLVCTRYESLPGSPEFEWIDNMVVERYTVKQPTKYGKTEIVVYLRDEYKGEVIHG